MSYATRMALVIVALLVLMLGGLAVNFYMMRYQIEHAQSQWCDTLDLITARPVSKPPDPAANPSREGQYQLYEDFIRLKQQFGCGG